jgi:hypothetical protein
MGLCGLGETRHYARHQSGAFLVYLALVAAFQVSLEVGVNARPAVVLQGPFLGFVEAIMPDKRLP